MMRDVNIISLLGNLARDPEIRYNLKGVAFVNCTIALNEKAYNENREIESVTTFISIDAIGFCAEDFKISCKKGDLIFLQGHFHMNKWIDKAGKAEERLLVRVNNFYLL